MPARLRYPKLRAPEALSASGLLNFIDLFWVFHSKKGHSVCSWIPHEPQEASAVCLKVDGGLLEKQADVSVSVQRQSGRELKL